MNAAYGFGVSMPVTYDEAVVQVKEALKTEGFGVLTEIDIRQTFREKLQVEMEPYLILGACNPVLAHRALQQEPQVGLLLPCNVVVRAEGAYSRVEIVDPQMMLAVANHPGMTPLAEEARQRLLRVLAVLSTSVG